MEPACRTTTTTTRPNGHHHHPLTRRNSIATSVIVPAKLTLPPPHLPHHSSASFPASCYCGLTSSSSTTSSTQSFPAVDFELLSIKPLSYTSLKDLLPSPAGLQSPTSSAPAAGGGSGYEISIRNRLVKQAAWAYLQPMSTSPDSSSSGSRHFLHRLWTRISGFLRFVRQAVTRALRAVRIGSSR